VGHRASSVTRPFVKRTIETAIFPICAVVREGRDISSPTPSLDHCRLSGERALDFSYVQITSAQVETQRSAHLREIELCPNLKNARGTLGRQEKPGAKFQVSNLRLLTHF
jgi:hypothetical protein